MITVKMSHMLGVSDVRDNVALLSSFDVFCKSYLKRACATRTAHYIQLTIESCLHYSQNEPYVR